ncbi:hypothetical protein F5Y17DRAFT_423128 [Xylariaceae sp. FL0594]|nr:hypothetical protein F5Y17DRAFT_423128 [Xylariaceae sp. FL0594]
MADARALLRAHRAENRIQHPHAAYSDAGKLSCKICHDIVKAESLWDTHIRSKSHREKLQLQSQLTSQDGDESANKRKRSGDVDEVMSDGEGDQDAARTKRSKTDGISHANTTPNGAQSGIHTPPGIARRASGTPSHGVEIAIPSRPATPQAGSNSSVSTPRVNVHRPLFSSSDSSSSLAAPTSQQQQQQQQAAAASRPISDESLPAAPAQRSAQAATTPGDTVAQQLQQSDPGAVDEAEWAAFEAEMSALESAPPEAVNGNTTSSSSHFAADAITTTISAPAMTAAQLAAKSQEEENERRKTAAEAEMADEREEATRALEAEFEEMEELEGRVRRLKERREKLRKESVMNLRQGAAAATTTTTTASTTLKGDTAVYGKENAQNDDSTMLGTGQKNIEEEDEDDDEDDDDEEDEFDGFRFRV